MSDIEAQLGGSGDAQAVIDTAISAAKPTALDDERRFYAVTVPAGGKAELLDVEAARTALLAQPRRKNGEYKVHDAESFAAYVDKHGDTATEVWADATASVVTGVLNAHEVGEPRWEDHKVTYRMLFTDAWKAWNTNDGRLLDQSAFAEHIEDRAIDIVTPSSADMLEVAQTFKATIGVKFESSKRLSSGERQLEYRETVEAKAGKAGKMDIPDTFVLGLKPFEGADPYKVTARLRYRIEDGVLRIGYRLERPGDVLREAFLGVVQQIEERLGVHALRGSR